MTSSEGDDTVAHGSAASVYDLSCEQVERLVGADAAGTVFRDLYQHGRTDGPQLRQLLEAAELGAIRPLACHRRDDGAMTSRFGFGLADGGAIETVRIQRRTSMTACVSTQLGCAFGCSFCASGRLGLSRQLRAGEIVQQVLALGPRINRLVFMGIGEPLHNYTQVLRAIRILRDRRGLGLKTSGITISTIGIPSRLRQLREEHLKINLTVSDRWARRHNRTVTYVYLLLPGHNASRTDAVELADLLHRRRARVNLMRWNPVVGGEQYAPASDRHLGGFKRQFERAGLPVTVRHPGRDIGCRLRPAVAPRSRCRRPLSFRPVQARPLRRRSTC